jgi:hypothetical protein
MNHKQVFISGELHGDERIGPLSSLMLAEVLCELYGSDEWLTRMVDTRLITIMPMTNAYGYAHSQREDGPGSAAAQPPPGAAGSSLRRRRGQLDPNRDFSYDPASPAGCMTTVTGRSVNEVWRGRLFQLAMVL